MPSHSLIRLLSSRSKYFSNQIHKSISTSSFFSSNLSSSNYSFASSSFPFPSFSPLARSFHSSSVLSHLPDPTPASSSTPSPVPTASAAATASASPSIKSVTQSASYLRPVLRGRRKCSIKFTQSDTVGALSDVLKFFALHNINMTRLESRPAKRNTDYDFFVDFVGDPSEEPTKALLKDIRGNVRELHILESRKVAWFPRRIKDLDLVANQILDAGSELQSDHPGFSDPVYRARRKELADIAIHYKQGTPIPKINYNENELKTWGTVYDRLTPLLAQHACAEHVRLLPLLVENCGYSNQNIPQLQDISNFLKECTGFTIRPVSGLLSARNFLYGLAFRVFFSTQYIRHHTKPLYTPEPDIVHELMVRFSRNTPYFRHPERDLVNKKDQTDGEKEEKWKPIFELGHAPLFADQAFADFSQEIGLASIGATDEQITKLARCYWFSVEFGLCLQNGERKAYGAGLLSSFGELEYSMSEKPEVREWDPFKAGEQDYPITTYQPVYYAAKSFEDAKQKMHAFSNSFARPFNVRYNPYTEGIEVDGNISVEGDE